MSATSQAADIASKGFGLLWTATVAGATGISGALSKAKKHYDSYCEKDSVEHLRKQGKPPTELLISVIQRFHYLSLAGYDNEAAAAARKLALKLADYEKSSVPLDAAIRTGQILVDATLKYGDFGKSSWLNLSDFLNTSRMGKDHYDRDSLVSDFYHALILLLETTGGVNERFENSLKEVAGKFVEGSSYQNEVASYNRYSSTAFNLDSLAGGLPSYAQPSTNLPSYARVPSATATATVKATSISSSGVKQEDSPQTMIAKSLFVVASAIKKATEEGDAKRQRSLKEAEDLFRREKQSATGFGSAGSKPPSISSSYSSSNYSYGSKSVAPVTSISSSSSGYSYGTGYLKP